MPKMEDDDLLPDERALAEGKPLTEIADILLPHGRFFFMAPTQTGTWKDLNTGIECSSLGQERYCQLLGNAGFRVISTYTDKGENHYYDAEKMGSAPQ